MRTIALAVRKALTSSGAQRIKWVVEKGRDVDFAARWVLGGIPVINLRTLSARRLLLKVGSSRGGHRAYYRMPEPDGVGRALRALGIAESAR